MQSPILLLFIHVDLILSSKVLNLLSRLIKKPKSNNNTASDGLYLRNEDDA